jgi:hypothetical protein
MKYIFSEDSLVETSDLLEELLEVEKNKFEKLLKIKHKDLTFESFEDESCLDYFWGLLNHFQ